MSVARPQNATAALQQRKLLLLQSDHRTNANLDIAGRGRATVRLTKSSRRSGGCGDRGLIPFTLAVRHDYCLATDSYISRSVICLGRDQVDAARAVALHSERNRKVRGAIVFASGEKLPSPDSSVLDSLLNTKKRPSFFKFLFDPLFRLRTGLSRTATLEAVEFEWDPAKSPNWPSALYPQAQTVPLLFSAKLCSNPPAMATTAPAR